MNPQKLIKNNVLIELTKAIDTFVNASYPQHSVNDLKIRIEYSRDEKFGDYSSPFALENKNLFGKNPKEIAEAVLQNLTGNSLFSEVSFSPPGFINFRISPFYLWQYVNQFRATNDYFARVTRAKKICLEFVSANPTGPMNIVSARSAAYGDALANLLTSLGHEVKREFYVNDYGNQVNLLGVAVLLRYIESKGEPLSFQEEEDERSLFELIEARVLPKESYRGEYIKEIAQEFISSQDAKDQLENLIGLKKWEEIIELLSKFAVHFNLTRQKRDLSMFGVRFDEFYSERTLHETGKVDQVPNHLKKEDLNTQDGKLYFLSTRYGDDKDRVIRRDDGRPTYLMADIAYHMEKFQRGFEELIDIWGPDHYGYIARLKGAISSFGKEAERFKVLIAQQVNLIENKEKVKMSKRLGVFQTMTDLLNYLGKNAKDVGRYFFLMRSADMPLDFDLDLAKDESEKNPVFYIQYAHARICSIFRELGEPKDFSLSELTDTSVLSSLESEDRARLLFWIARFPEEVYDSAITLEPHRITNYLQSLSKAFTKFYGNKENRIKDKTGLEKEVLLILSNCAKLTIGRGLALLGISAPEKMTKEDTNLK
jgi:arginyl-tRNA synthetase